MRSLLRFAISFVLLGAAAARAQQVGPPRTLQYPFAVGGGAEIVTDSGTASDVKAFSFRGFHAFGEVVLETGIVLQLRYQNFTLPGTPVTPPFGETRPAPDVRVNAGIASVGYLFRESWWDGGFVGGVGVYWLNPKSPSGNQVPNDTAETVVGWHGGLVSAFHIERHWDIRLEANFYLLRTNYTHKPITLGGSVAYHF